MLPYAVAALPVDGSDAGVEGRDGCQGVGLDENLIDGRHAHDVLDSSGDKILPAAVAIAKQPLLWLCLQPRLLPGQVVASHLECGVRSLDDERIHEVALDILAVGLHWQGQQQLQNSIRVDVHSL